MIIDIFGYEYGYLPSETIAMPITGAILLLNRIKERYNTNLKAQNEISINQLRDIMKLK